MKPVSYRTMIDELLALRASQGVPAFSLTDVFSESKDTIYADAIHYEIEAPGRLLDIAILGRRHFASEDAAGMDTDHGGPQW